jgi:hypothetical protein
LFSLRGFPMDYEVRFWYESGLKKFGDFPIIFNPLKNAGFFSAHNALPIHLNLITANNFNSNFGNKYRLDDGRTQ